MGLGHDELREGARVRLLIVCPSETGVRKLDMQETNDAFYRGGESHFGFQMLTPVVMPLPIPDTYLAEYISCEMYEGGNVCGIYTDDDDKLAFSWALLPETRFEAQHIDQVILSYGRGGRVQPAKNSKEAADG